jgi:hypothetical protein
MRLFAFIAMSWCVAATAQPPQVFTGVAFGERGAKQFRVGVDVVIAPRLGVELEYIREKGPHDHRTEDGGVGCPSSAPCAMPSTGTESSQEFQRKSMGFGVSLIGRQPISSAVSLLGKAGYSRMWSPEENINRFIAGAGMQFGSPAHGALRIMIENQQIWMGSVSIVHSF